MSRILRRPMFRGGRVDSRGTGITSGLDRPGYSGGGSTGLTPQTTTGGQLLNQALGQPGTFIGDTNRLLGNVREGLFNYISRPLGNIPIAASNYAFGTDFDYIPPMDYEQEVLDLINKAQTKKSTSGSAQASEIGLDDDEDTDDATVSEMIAEGTDKKTPVQKATESSNTQIPKKKPIDLGDDDEVSLTDVEKSKKEYAELLGIQKARSRDIYDMLGRFSAASLNAPSLRDAFADYMALEAKAGPGRAERIQEAAGTIAVKEKIAGKQLDKRIAAALAKSAKGTDMTRMIALLKDKTLDSTTRQVILSKIGRQPSIQAELNKLRLEGKIDASTVNQIAPLYISDYVGLLTPASKEDGVYLDPNTKSLIRLEKGKPTPIGTLNY